MLIGIRIPPIEQAKVDDSVGLKPTDVQLQETKQYTLCHQFTGCAHLFIDKDSVLVFEVRLQTIVFNKTYS